MFYNIAKPQQYNSYNFICDTEDDINDLPTFDHIVKGYAAPATGSKAFVIDEVSGYIYGNDNTWHKIF